MGEETQEEPLGFTLLRAWGPLRMYQQLGRVLLHWEPEALGREVIVGVGRLPVGGFVVWIGEEIDGLMLVEIPQETYQTAEGVVLLAILGDITGAWKTYWELVRSRE